jgi:hypothetical protein
MTTQPPEDFKNRCSYTKHDIIHREVCSNIKRSIAKDYLDGRLNLHVHVRFGTEEYCAVFDRNSIIGPVGDLATRPTDTYFLPQGAPGEQEVMMLVYITENVEVPEMLPVIVYSRAVARLKRIYDGDYCIGDPSELSELLMVVSGNILEDWELVASRGLIPLRKNELPNKVVEGTSEVVEHFPDAQANIIRHGRHVSETIDLISRIRFGLFCDNIGFEVTEGRQFSGQFLALFLGPVAFSERTIKGGNHEQDSSQTKDSSGIRDTYSTEGRGSRSLREGDQTNQAKVLNSPPPLEEVKSQTAYERHHGDCISKHTHLGSPEDA